MKTLLPGVKETTYVSQAQNLRGQQEDPPISAAGKHRRGLSEWRCQSWLRAWGTRGSGWQPCCREHSTVGRSGSHHSLRSYAAARPACRQQSGPRCLGVQWDALAGGKGMTDTFFSVSVMKTRTFLCYSRQGV